MTISKVPTPSWFYRMVFMPSLDKTHIWDLSEDDVRIFYMKLFENRTDKNKLYIDRYTSLIELEEDIYNECTHKYTYTTTPFKEIYNTLDKQTFLNKINDMIEEYGNAIIGEDYLMMCVKTDEPSLRLIELYDNIINSTY